MKGRANRHAVGFTLIELLTVIAIISLLIGILVPSLSAARNQARNASSAGLIKAIETGAEMFHSENGSYPRSGGFNPFYAASQNKILTGAQWIGLQLMGADQLGFVKPTLQNDTSTAGTPDGVINEQDWQAWYDPTAPTDKFARLGPYVNPDPKNVKTPIQYVQENPDASNAPAVILEDDSNPAVWANGRLAFFVDAHGFPILYYRANAFAKQPISAGGPAGNSSYRAGNYDQTHNGYITGYDALNGEMPVTGYNQGWDLNGRGGPPGQPVHPMGYIGWANPQQAQDDGNWPEASPSFATALLDRSIFDTTSRGGNRGRLAALKPETFVLIAPGRDGLYGTSDDIKNFAAGGE